MTDDSDYARGYAQFEAMVGAASFWKSTIESLNVPPESQPQ